MHQRVRHGQVAEALGVLAALDWSVTGGECYRALSAVAEHLLRLPLNAEREGETSSSSPGGPPTLPHPLSLPLGGWGV